MLRPQNFLKVDALLGASIELAPDEVRSFPFMVQKGEDEYIVAFVYKMLGDDTVEFTVERLYIFEHMDEENIIAMPQPIEADIKGELDVSKWAPEFEPDYTKLYEEYFVGMEELCENYDEEKMYKLIATVEMDYFLPAYIAVANWFKAN